MVVEKRQQEKKIEGNWRVKQNSVFYENIRIFYKILYKKSKLQKGGRMQGIIRKKSYVGRKKIYLENKRRKGRMEGEWEKEEGGREGHMRLCMSLEQVPRVI